MKKSQFFFKFSAMQLKMENRVNSSFWVWEFSLRISRC